MSVTDSDPADVLLRKQKGAAEGRVAAALVTIEEAQRQLAVASDALSSVKGMACEWRRVRWLHDEAKRHRHAVKAKSERLRGRGCLRVDHVPDLAEMQWDVVRRRGQQ